MYVLTTCWLPLRFCTTVKDGITLNLTGVDWQVTGTDLVGEVLSPSSWQAVATYSGQAYYSAADGYITTADYVGEIARNDVESVTYQLTYLGTEYVEDDDTEFPDSHESSAGSVSDFLSGIWPFAVGGTGLAAAAVLGVLLWRSRKRSEAAQDDEEDLEETEEETEDNP